MMPSSSGEAKSLLPEKVGVGDFIVNFFEIEFQN